MIATRRQKLGRIRKWLHSDELRRAGCDSIRDDHLLLSSVARAPSVPAAAHAPSCAVHVSVVLVLIYFVAAAVAGIVFNVSVCMWACVCRMCL